MKHYKALVQKGNVELVLPIADGQSFIFSFPYSAYSRATSIGITLYFNNAFAYSATFIPLLRKTTFRDGGDPYTYKPPARSANIVIRVEKAFQNSVKTFINNELIQTLYSRSMIAAHNAESRIDTAGVAFGTANPVVVTLTVLKYAEYDKVEAFAKAMQNPATSDLNFDFENDEGDLKREDLINLDVTDIRNPSPGESVRPQDADIMKLSSTVAWPKAVSQLLGSSVGNVQKEHDNLMQKWVIERGDGLSSNAYDYFVYSHGVAWPKAILEYHQDADFLKIVANHINILTVLEDALNALGQ